jgi:hypothetical protein
MSHAEQEALSLPEHLSSFPVFSGVLVARSLVVCVAFCRSFFVLFLGHCNVSPSIYGFWLPLWYLLWSTLPWFTLVSIVVNIALIYLGIYCGQHCLDLPWYLLWSTLPWFTLVSIVVNIALIYLGIYCGQHCLDLPWYLLWSTLPWLTLVSTVVNIPLIYLGIYCGQHCLDLPWYLFK